MEWIQQAVRDFGASVGEDELEFDADNGLELTLDGGALLGIAFQAELPLQEMLVYMYAPLGFDPLCQMEAALRLANDRYNGHGPVQTAVGGDQLIMAVRLSAREFDLPLLDHTVGLLCELHREAANAV